jgi:hypothetical protein
MCTFSQSVPEIPSPTPRTKSIVMVACNNGFNASPDAGSTEGAWLDQQHADR